MVDRSALLNLPVFRSCQGYLSRHVPPDRTGRRRLPRRSRHLETRKLWRQARDDCQGRCDRLGTGQSSRSLLARCSYEAYRFVVSSRWAKRTGRSLQFSLRTVDRCGRHSHRRWVNIPSSGLPRLRSTMVSERLSARCGSDASDGKADCAVDGAC